MVIHALLENKAGRRDKVMEEYLKPDSLTLILYHTPASAAKLFPGHRDRDMF